MSLNTQVYTIDDGTVQMSVRTKSGTAVRAFCHRGRLVYEVWPDGHKSPIGPDLSISSTGLQLMVRSGETLEDAIRRALAVRDGSYTPSRRERIEEWILDRKPGQIFGAALALALVIALIWSFK